MFKVEIADDYGDIIDNLSVDTLEEALDFVKGQILEGRATDQITLMKEINLSITVDVQVKAD